LGFSEDTDKLTGSIKSGTFLNILFFGPCIFNDEDEINQQNTQINSGLIYY